MRIFVPLLTVLLFADVALAQNSQEQVKYNSFGVPEQVLKIIVPNQSDEAEKNDNAKPFPECSDPLLINKIQNILNNDKSNIEEESIVQRRARILAAKNMTNFTPIDIDKFTPKTNRDVANIMISAKINQGLSDDDFAICEGDNPILKRRVYLLMQRLDSEIIVFIVNYRIGRIPSFNL